MVEERNELPGTEPAVEEEISPLRMVVGFLLTLILVPFLFVGACFGIFVVGPGGALTLAFAIAVLLVLLAVKTKNPGIRWAIVLIGVLIAIALAIALLSR